MSRESLLNYLTRKSDSYEHVDSLTMTTARVADYQAFYTPICERPFLHPGYDVFGVHWSEAEPSCHYTQGQEPIIHDIKDWRDEVRIPVVGRFDWGWLERQAEGFDRENKVIITTLPVGPFERSSCLSSFEDCLVNAVSDPENYAGLIGALADYKIEVIRHVHRYARPDIINLHDDWGTSISTFFRPDHWREVIKPHTKRMYDAVHEGGALVSQHSDGAIGPLVPDMVEMGADIWEGGREIPGQLPGLQDLYGDRLRIVTPMDTLELTRGGAVGKEAKPDAATMTPNYRPYDTVPEFLYG